MIYAGVFADRLKDCRVVMYDLSAESVRLSETIKIRVVSGSFFRLIKTEVCLCCFFRLYVGSCFLCFCNIRRMRILFLLSLLVVFWGKCDAHTVSKVDDRLYGLLFLLSSESLNYSTTLPEDSLICLCNKLGSRH